MKHCQILLLKVNLADFGLYEIMCVLFKPGPWVYIAVGAKLFLSETTELFKNKLG
jgi:hypothetical protein